MKHQKLRGCISIIVMLVLVLSNFSFVSAGAVEYDIYNITKKIGYVNPLTDEEIAEIIEDANAGDEFAKRIGGKLVNFNEYYNKLLEVYAENIDLSFDEIIDIIIEQIPAILESLDEVVAEEESPDVDKEELAEAIAYAEQLDEEDYTAESWQALVEALEEAIIVYEDPEATQEEVDEALEALDLAIEGLKTIDEPYVKAVYTPSLIPFMGYVTVTPYNIPDAHEYTVMTKLSDGREETSLKMGFGQTENLPLVYYNETATIKVYNADGDLLHTFENVTLSK